MKPEPLKGKTFWIGDISDIPGAGGRDVANKYDIRAAVEDWIVNHEKHCKICRKDRWCIDRSQIYHDFEDVMKQ